MEQGQFCFIVDEFYTVHDKEHKLMKNKESLDGKEHGRPCFYAFSDKKNPSILWCVPISSQVDKYTRIYNHKLDKQKEKGVKTPKCNTIRFGEVMGVKKAFLIQNMFPIIDKYIGEIYINRLTQEAVRIPQNTERDIVFYAALSGGGLKTRISDILQYKSSNLLSTSICCGYVLYTCNF